MEMMFANNLQNLDQLSGAAGRLNLLARATGEEVDQQNKHIANIINKASDLPVKHVLKPLTDSQSDRVDEQIVMNRARLDRIH